MEAFEEIEEETETEEQQQEEFYGYLAEVEEGMLLFELTPKLFLDTICRNSCAKIISEFVSYGNVEVASSNAPADLRAKIAVISKWYASNIGVVHHYQAQSALSEGGYETKVSHWFHVVLEKADEGDEGDGMLVNTSTGIMTPRKLKLIQEMTNTSAGELSNDVLRALHFPYPHLPTDFIVQDPDIVKEDKKEESRSHDKEEEVLEKKEPVLKKQKI